MIVIRPEQMRALEEAQVERFADELVTHIEGFAPIQFGSMGKEAVRNTISMGLKGMAAGMDSHCGDLRVFMSR